MLRLASESERDDAYLYRGKVYVDSEDFAVTQIEAACQESVILD